MGEYRPITVATALAARFEFTFKESWAVLQQQCANLSAGSLSIAIYGL